MTNMQKYAPSFTDGALPASCRCKWALGLNRMAATPRRWRLFCSGTLCARAGAMEAGFVPALDKD